MSILEEINEDLQILKEEFQKSTKSQPEINEKIKLLKDRVNDKRYQTDVQMKFNDINLQDTKNKRKMNTLQS